MKTDTELMNNPAASLTKTELEARRALIAKTMKDQDNYVAKDEDSVEYEKLPPKSANG